MSQPAYDPRSFRGLTFHDAAARFADGTDTPRAYLERCLETIAAREPVVQAFAALNPDGARAAADASTARWRAGRTLSPIDGMPVGIKDLLETRDMPTEMGCAAYRGNFPRRDNAAVWALLRRADHPWIEALEQAVGNARAVCNAITGWENRWAQRSLVDLHPEGVSARAKAALARAEAMRPDDYRAALVERDAAQLRHRALAPLADAAITLACPGPAPLWSGDRPGEPLNPRPTGDFVFNAPSSLLFAPAVTVPLMAVGGMPVGVQVMGQPHEDAAMTSIARWMLANIPPVSG